MTDQALLFHNPDVLSDSDLGLVKRRMAVQSWMPWTTAFITGSSWFLYDLGIRKAGFCWMRVAAATFIGYTLSGLASHKVNHTFKSSFSQNAVDFMDTTYLKAYDKKFAEKAVNSSGYGNNALREAAHLTKNSPAASKAYN